MRSPLTVVLAAAAVLVAGCGTATQAPGGGPDVDPVWASTSVPATPGADSPTVLATEGDDVVVLTVSDEGAVRSSLSSGGEGFETGAPLETGLRYFALGGAAAHDGGWFALGSGGTAVVDGDDELVFEVAGLRSDDGLEWTEVPVEGFAGPADLNALTEVGGRLVAAGSYREAPNPGMGGFRATVWHSEDGTAWTEASLPGVGAGESYVADLATVGDRVIAVGSAGGHGMLWTSDDGGSSWQRGRQPDLEDAYALSRVTAEGETAVVSTMAGDEPAQILRSTDGGDTWVPAATPPPVEDVEGYAPLWSGGGRFFTVTSSFLEPWSEPGVCYADIERCRQDSVVTLYTSPDGDTWERVDTSGIGAGEAGEVDEVTATDDGRVLAVQVRSDEVLVHTWPAGAALPVAPPLTDPPAVDPVEVPENGVLEPGVRYHAPLYVHCGMDWLYLGERAWRRSDGGPDMETGAGDDPDPSWPVAGEAIFGYATLVDGVVEYSLDDGEVIATYERTRERPPGCD